MKDQSHAYTEAEGTALRQKLSAAIAAQTKATIAMAELLTAVYHGKLRKGAEDVPLVVAWGHEDFDEFAEHELGIHQTTARGLVLLYEELYIRRPSSDGSLDRLGVTKLRLLARVSKRVPDGRAFNSWVSKAAEMSCCEFEEAVDTEFGSDRKFRPLGFRLKLSKYSGFMRKMRSARDSLGVHSNGEALSMIVDEWHERHSKEDRVRAKRTA